MRGVKGNRSLSVASRVESCILVLRGQKIILSDSLAEIYGMDPRILVRTVEKNRKCFPEDFIFQLTEEEGDSLRSKLPSRENDGDLQAKSPPFAFNELGVKMLPTVFRKPKEIMVNIEILRTFGQVQRSDELERKLKGLLREPKHKRARAWRVKWQG
jgi:hypothetical protein